MLELTSAEELSSYVEKNRFVLVDFSAVWCGPCRMLSPVLDQIALEFPNIKFLKVDIDKLPQLASKYQVSSVPFVVLFKDGKQIDSFVGARDASFVKEFLAKCNK